VSMKWNHKFHAKSSAEPGGHFGGYGPVNKQMRRGGGCMQNFRRISTGKASLPWIGEGTGPNSLRGKLCKLLIKPLKHEIAFSLYTFGCDQTAFFEEPHVSRY
jgi:hypothetical protein